MFFFVCNENKIELKLRESKKANCKNIKVRRYSRRSKTFEVFAALFAADEVNFGRSRAHGR